MGRCSQPSRHGKEAPFPTSMTCLWSRSSDFAWMACLSTCRESSLFQIESPHPVDTQVHTFSFRLFSERVLVCKLGLHAWLSWPCHGMVALLFVSFVSCTLAICCCNCSFFWARSTYIDCCCALEPIHFGRGSLLSLHWGWGEQRICTRRTR